jgi:hypothetical protein
LPIRFGVDTTSGRIEFSLALVPPQRLRPHEEVIPREVRKLTKSFTDLGIQHDPIIVDEDTLTVLDGMHRLAATKALGIRNVLCMTIDYLNPAIRVDTWNRQFRGSPKVVAELASRLSDRKLPTLRVVTAKQTETIVGEDMNALDSCKSFTKFIKEVEKLLGPETITASRIPVQGSFLLVPPLVSKEDIINMAQIGTVLPPKSTRHVFPVRVLTASVPLNLMNSRLDPAELNSALAAYFRKHDIVVGSGGLEYGGRKYEEEKLFFFA